MSPFDIYLLLQFDLFTFFIFETKRSPKTPEGANPSAFMKKIGWLDENEADVEIVDVNDEPKPLVEKKTQTHKKNFAPAPTVQPYNYAKHNASEFGLKKVNTPEKKKKQQKETPSVNVPHFGKVANTRRNNTSTQSKNASRSNTYRTNK